MRGAIYARVSSERQEKEHTIGSQLEALRNYANQHGIEIVEEFTDEGYSGARLDRPALDRMRDLAERRGFEVLLSYCTDRLARKFVLQALILDELERFGVKAIFLEGGAADDPLSKLMHQITGAVAEFERAKITERNRRGKLYRARCGEIVTGEVRFGYVRIPRRDGVASHVEIREDEAVVVRRIFDAYVQRGQTIRHIAKQLTLEGSPNPSGGREWHRATVNRILHNEAYIGTLYYSRRNCVMTEGARAWSEAAFGQSHPSAQGGMDPDFSTRHHRLRELSSSRHQKQRQSEILSAESAGDGLSFAEARPLWALRVELLCQDSESNEGKTQALLYVFEHEQFF